MSTVADPRNGTQTAIAKPAAKPETTIAYVPLGETGEITLTLSRVKQFLCVPTRSGKIPTDEQVVKFMMLCKAQSLNPWVNDAYLVGYDSKDGATFSLITAHQAFLKRAEASPEFEGMESGVIVLKDGQILERPGDLVLIGEMLVGAWARVHRRDRKIPTYDSLNLKTFDTGRSRWAIDPAGMIVKCAEASCLRKAFPSTLAAMYCKEEMDRERDARDHVVATETKPKSDRLADRLIGQVKTSDHVETSTSEVNQEPVNHQSSETQEPEQKPAEPKELAGLAAALAKCKNDSDVNDIQAQWGERQLSDEQYELLATECGKRAAELAKGK